MALTSEGIVTIDGNVHPEAKEPLFPFLSPPVSFLYYLLFPLPPTTHLISRIDQLSWMEKVLSTLRPSDLSPSISL